MSERFVTTSDISGRTGGWGVTNVQEIFIPLSNFACYFLHPDTSLVFKRGLTVRGKIV